MSLVALILRCVVILKNINFHLISLNLLHKDQARLLTEIQDQLVLNIDEKLDRIHATAIGIEANTEPDRKNQDDDWPPS